MSNPFKIVLAAVDTYDFIFHDAKIFFHLNYINFKNIDISLNMTKLNGMTRHSLI